MMTPDPDSSTCRVLPGLAAFVASIDTTAGDTLLATASNRSLSFNKPASTLAGESELVDWAVKRGEFGSKSNPVNPPPNEQSPITINSPRRFHMVVSTPKRSNHVWPQTALNPL